MAGGPARRIPRSTRRKTSLRSPGVIPALTLRGVPFSISAATDFSALFGIAILNGVVLASYPRPGGVRLRRPEAATRAAALRLQPVMMTALTTGLGFLPMALATGAGAEVQRPLAIVIIRGLIAATLLTCGAIAAFVLLSRWLRQPWRRTFVRAAVLCVPVTLTVGAYLTYNRVIFKTLAISPAGQTFFLANLIEYGPARDYLRDACPGAGYKICTQVETLPSTANAFMWEAGYLDRLGGFTGMSVESAAIVRATVMSRPGAVATMVAGNLWRALGAHAPDTDVSSEFPPYSAIFEVIALKFGPQALAAFQASAQMRDVVPHRLIRTADTVLIALAWVLAAATCMVALVRGERALAALPLFFAACVLGDALVCSALSGVFDRYQARVIWLLPMAALLCLVCVREGSRQRLGGA